MYYIVPSADQTPQGFVVRRDSVAENYVLPLEENTVPQLRSLARWLNITGKGQASKPELVEEIQKRLTLVPLETAAAVHPILAAPVPSTSADCASRVAALVLLGRQDPLVRVHAGWAIEQAEAQMRTLVIEEQRAAYAAEEARWREPAWMADALPSAPAGPHYKIMLRTGEQEHDGYCTGTEEDELYVSAWEESTVYLPVTSVDAAAFNAKGLWSNGGGGGHCCCGARTLTELTGWERVG